MGKLYHPACRCCTSSFRATIDTMVVRGAASALIAEKISAACPNEPAISVSSVGRHRTRHLAAEYLAKARAKDAMGLDGDFNVDELRTRESSNVYRLLVLNSLVEQAVAAGDLAVASSLIGRRTKLLEATARVLDLLGPVGTTVTNNFILSTDYIELRSQIIRALAPPEFAAARNAVVSAMLQIESKPVEVVDVEVKLIEAGAGEATEILLPLAEPSPAVTHLEQFISGATTPKEQVKNG